MQPRFFVVVYTSLHSPLSSLSFSISVISDYTNNHYAVEYSNIVYHHRTLLFVEVVKKLFRTAHYDEYHIFNFIFDLNCYTNGGY